MFFLLSHIYKITSSIDPSLFTLSWVEWANHHACPMASVTPPSPWPVRVMTLAPTQLQGGALVFAFRRRYRGGSWAERWWWHGKAARS